MSLKEEGEVTERDPILYDELEAVGNSDCGAKPVRISSVWLRSAEYEDHVDYSEIVFIA